MADKDREKADADEDSGENAEKGKKGGIGVKDIVILTLSALLLVGVSVAGTAMYLGTNPPVVVASDPADENDEAMERGKKKAKKKKKKKKKDKKIPETVFYQSLDPAFVVNFEEDDELHFLQITVEVMTYENSVIENVRKHMPAIRNGLVLLLSKQSYKALNEEKGKEQLRTDALTTIRNVLKRYTGNAGVEAVYFTSFVMQ